MPNEKQAILFNKNKWTEPEVEQYLLDNNIHKIKPIHVTDNFYRVRLHVPNFRQYFTTKEKKGIKYVIGY